MALVLSPYTWRVVISGTYTTAAAATTAYNSAAAIVAAYNATPRAGRWPAGISQPTNTQVTVSYETDDETEATTMAKDLQTNMSKTNRSNVISGVYRGNTP